MTKEQATIEARKIVESNGIPILLYSDPIGNAEDFEGPWGFCPPAAAEMLAKYREKEKDEVLNPGL